MANRGFTIITVNVKPDQHDRIKARAHELSKSVAQYVRDLINVDMGLTVLDPATGWPDTPGFVVIGDGHRVKYEDLNHTAIMLNNMINKSCACQFCREPMELVDMRRRFDQFDDEDAQVYENLELFYECGNGDCHSGTRTMIEYGA